MDYRKLLDFKNQKLVEQVYERVKDENEPEIEEAYQEITQKNQTRYQDLWKKTSDILDVISQVWGIIGMIIFAIIFIITGSIVLSSFLMIVNVTLIETFNGFYNWVCQIGISVYDSVFADIIKITATEYLNGVTDYSTVLSLSQGFYVLGMSSLLSVLFTVIYIASFFKKVKVQNNDIKLSLDDCYHYLQVHEDDSFTYIKYCFQRKFKRRHRDYFERYYQSYITIFHNYQEIEGTFHDLTTQQKIKMIFFTTINTLKNVLGSFSKPLFFSLVLVIIYWQNFTYTNLLTLEIFLEALPLFGSFLIFLLNTSYNIIAHTPFSSLLLYVSLDFAKLLTFCICITVICFIYSVLTCKIIESLRQYKRRLNYYLKLNQGIYQQGHVYKKSYRYSIQFLVFAVMVTSALGAIYLNETQSPLVLMSEEDRLSAMTQIEIRNKVKKNIDDYAFDHHQLSMLGDGVYKDEYIYLDKLTEFSPLLSNTYMKIYTFYNEEAAIKKMKDIKGFKIVKNDNYEYGLSTKGFVIRDKGVLIIMANEKSFDEISAITKPLSLNELKQLMSMIGYSVKE